MESKIFFLQRVDKTFKPISITTERKESKVWKCTNQAYYSFPNEVFRHKAFKWSKWKGEKHEKGDKVSRKKLLPEGARKHYVLLRLPFSFNFCGLSKKSEEKEQTLEFIEIIPTFQKWMGHRKQVKRA